jgi:carbon monoxide dehydrogenase subunit G
MKLEQSFEVAAPLEQVWQTLIDVEHVAPCLPGAAVTGRNDDGSYNGTFTVKIGPTTASYSGKLEMENIDEASHTATMQAQGTDKRGQGGAKATILSRLAPADDHGTRVEVVTDYHITGRLARFGRGGMIEDISERLLREFAKRLQSSLAAEPERAADTVVSPAPEEPAEAAPQPEPAVDTVVSPAPEEPAEAAPPPVEDAVEPPTEVLPPSEIETPIEAAAAPEEPPAPPPPPVTPPPPPPAAETRPPLSHPLEPSEPMQGLSLVGTVVWGRIKRNPAPAAAAGVAVVLLLARRRRRRH